MQRVAAVVTGKVRHVVVVTSITQVVPWGKEDMSRKEKAWRKNEGWCVHVSKM